MFVGKKLFVSMVLMLSLMFLCASLRASALSDGHEAEPQVDTLNILGSDSQHFDSVADGSDEDGSLAFLRRRHKGKVEGTLTYKKGWIYTSDNLPLSVEDAKFYFSPKQVKIYRRNVKVFNSGNYILGVGAGAGLAGGIGFACAASDTDYDDIRPVATLVSSCLVTVAVIAPCAVIGVPMMAKSKARLKRLVKEYNTRYLFAE